jgi:hypothetical protein
LKSLEKVLKIISLNCSYNHEQNKKHGPFLQELTIWWKRDKSSESGGVKTQGRRVGVRRNEWWSSPRMGGEECLGFCLKLCSRGHRYEPRLCAGHPREGVHEVRK